MVQCIVLRLFSFSLDSYTVLDVVVILADAQQRCERARWTYAPLARELLIEVWEEFWTRAEFVHARIRIPDRPVLAKGMQQMERLHGAHEAVARLGHRLARFAKK
jgi:hypothetical protein